MDGKNLKKDDENSQLSCGIYSYISHICIQDMYTYPAEARLSLQRLGRRSLDAHTLNLAFTIMGGDYSTDINKLSFQGRKKTFKTYTGTCRTIWNLYDD